MLNRRQRLSPRLLRRLPWRVGLGDGLPHLRPKQVLLNAIHHGGDPETERRQEQEGGTGELVKRGKEL